MDRVECCYRQVQVKVGTSVPQQEPTLTCTRLKRHSHLLIHSEDISTRNILIFELYDNEYYKLYE